MRVRTAALVALAATTFLLVGCGGSSTSTTEDFGVAGDVGVAEPGMPPEQMTAPQEAGTVADGSGMATSTTTMQRQVVRSGSMGLQADDVAKTVAQIRSLTAAAQGFISAENSSASGGGAYSSITAQVPAAKLDGFIEAVSKLGTVESIDLSAQDVTSQVVDLDARIKALQTSVDRMTDLMAQASQISDLLTIETQLSQRQAELDALKAQRTWLGDQVAMSTLAITVWPVPTVEPVDAPGFLDGLEQGWAALVSTVLVAATALGFFLPFLVVLAIVAVPIAVLLVWLTRRHRRRLSEQPPADAPQQVPAEPPAQP